PAAKEIAQKKGIADPQKDQACLKCHDTAAGVAAAQLAPTFKAGEGVGCESCHGAGSEYKTMSVMKDIDAGKVKGETVGLVKGDEKLCVKCHNSESPTFKGFNYAEYSKKIAHPTPKP
ncbi:cytochrome C554, partial [candidate division KSB1 bacterium]|nr:cytochrome C554 [candidate division KSB1 bacterium]